MILFQDKIKFNGEAFFTKLKKIAADLGVQPDWIMAVMNSETGGTFNPQIVNKQKASTPGYDGDGKQVKSAGIPDSANDFERSKYRATGLIQFMPKTAKNLGTSTQQLFKMSNVQQLDYVYKYFLSAKADYKTNFEHLRQLHYSYLSIS